MFLFPVGNGEDTDEEWDFEEWYSQKNIQDKVGDSVNNVTYGFVREIYKMKSIADYENCLSSDDDDEEEEDDDDDDDEEEEDDDDDEEGDEEDDK